MAYALARTARLKVGTSVAVLPGRHRVLDAKQLASLAALAPGRVLPVFGLRSAIRAEREIFVVPAGERAAVFDESLRLLRSVLENDDAAFPGRYFRLTSAAELIADRIVPASAGDVVHDCAGMRRAVVRRRLGVQPGPEVSQFDDQFRSAAAGLDRLTDQRGDVFGVVGLVISRSVGVGVMPDGREQDLSRVIAFVN